MTKIAQLILHELKVVENQFATEFLLPFAFLKQVILRSLPFIQTIKVLIAFFVARGTLTRS